MKAIVIRYSTSAESTLGLLFLDGQFQCYTLEDAYHTEKIPGKTRIPAGSYSLSLRTYGTKHAKYLKKYGSHFHHGMLQISDVPGFTDILFHIGNSAGDTEGCILVGDGANNNQLKDGFISSSGQAYEQLYPKIAGELRAGRTVSLHFSDPADCIPTETLPRQTVDTKQLYLREVPYGLPRGVLYENTKVEVLRSRLDWSHVRVEGWVSKGYLR